ncbi:ArnT family glycosyltransferase [Planococcus salinus]|uniref:Glycosyltransferase RgtA/B/C/D-like domain-containing protein n=1 Tax=Planococcus salinus TaxID=1848460 RepID=A0A3M8P963_9BACL|nr:glycosyltransferase family 39 protein [Planococcus salinus]RNF39971.1 hypothetical protein EEX84_04830 [Planococcus salinus]
MFTKLKKLNPWLWVPLAIGLIIRLAVLFFYGPGLSLNSDDYFYIDSAKHLLAEGELVYVNHEEPTVHIMPGLPMLVAAVFFIFGTGTFGLAAAKVVMILIGCLSIAGIYKIGERLFSPVAGSIAALITALYLPMVVTDNLIATESPTTAAFIFFVYFSMRLADTHSMKDFFWVIGLYLFMLYFRPTVALFPFFLLIYLMLKKYSFKLGLKQFGIAVILLLVVMGPWWFRNYVAYDAFIPLSGGAGNPTLLGTYQGHGYKYGPPMAEVVLSIEEEYPDSTRYEQNQYQMEVAKERIQTMWEHNPDWFIQTYTTSKLRIQWEDPFYWIEVFGVSIEEMKIIFRVLFWTSLVSFLLVFAFNKGTRREFFFISLFILYFTVMNNLYLAYPRYNQPLLPFLFLGTGGFVHMIVRPWWTRRTRQRYKESPASGE